MIVLLRLFQVLRSLKERMLEVLNAGIGLLHGLDCGSQGESLTLELITFQCHLIESLECLLGLIVLGQSIVFLKLFGSLSPECFNVLLTFQIDLLDVQLKLENLFTGNVKLFRDKFFILQLIFELVSTLYEFQVLQSQVVNVISGLLEA